MGADSLPDVLAIALDVTSRLEHVDVPYVIGGSLASSVHGDPRATMDIDLVTDLQPDSVERVVAILRPDYYVDDAAARDAVRTAGAFNAVHVHAGIKVDFFVAGGEAFELERLRTRVAVPVGTPPSHTLWIDTAEHTVSASWSRTDETVRSLTVSGATYWLYLTDPRSHRRRPTPGIYRR